MSIASDSVIVFIDHQDSYYPRLHQAEQTKERILALARVARLLDIPIVVTTNMSAGRNGPQWRELTEQFDGQEVIDRTLIDAWKDEQVRKAITDTGRKRVIISGTGFDVCASLPAMSAVADGYAATVAFDACGRFEPMPTIAVNRLVTARVDVANVHPIALELMVDNAHPKAGEVYGVLFGGG